jgi:DNA-binding CsgD family transcriptional regulator
MTLSSREIDIFEKLVLNKSEDSIDEALDLDESQVKKLIELLMKKYRVDSLSALKVIGRHYFSDLRTDQS